MLIREWRGEGPLAGIEIEIHHTATRGWCVMATGSWQEPDEGELIPVDAMMPPVSSRSPGLILDMVEGAIQGQNQALQTIAQWAITNSLIAHRKAER